MLMKHIIDNKIYKSDDSINWTIATVEDVYEVLAKKEKECEKLKKKLDILNDVVVEIYNIVNCNIVKCADTEES